MKLLEKRSWVFLSKIAMHSEKFQFFWRKDEVIPVKESCLSAKLIQSAFTHNRYCNLLSMGIPCESFSDSLSKSREEWDLAYPPRNVRKGLYEHTCRLMRTNVKSCTFQKTRTFLEKITSFLSFLNRFISRTKRFHSFNYACLSVELLQSSAADCMVRCSGPYSLLQWTVQSIAVDCNNLPFKRTWLTPGNGLFFPLFVIWYLNPRE